MVAKKISAKLAPKLVFKKDWVIDPGPELKKVLSAAAIKQLALAKREFGDRVNEILKKG